jgi:hypothetical protein
MTGHLTGPLLDFYLFYLEIDHPSQLRFGYEIFLDDDIGADDLDDISQLPHPERFTRELLLNDVHTREYAVGRVDYRYQAWGMDASTSSAVFTLTTSC